MKSIKLHLIVLVIIVIAELIGNIVINVGIGKIVLLPMMYALIMGVLTAPKFTKISGEKEFMLPADFWASLLCFSWRATAHLSDRHCRKSLQRLLP